MIITDDEFFLNLVSAWAADSSFLSPADYSFDSNQYYGDSGEVENNNG